MFIRLVLHGINIDDALDLHSYCISKIIILWISSVWSLPKSYISRKFEWPKHRIT